MAVDDAMIEVGLTLFEMSLLLDRYADDLRAREAKSPAAGTPNHDRLIARRARFNALERENLPRHHEEVLIVTLAPAELLLLLYGMHHRQGMLDAVLVASSRSREALGQTIVRQERNRDRIAEMSALLGD